MEGLLEMGVSFKINKPYKSMDSNIDSKLIVIKCINELYFIYPFIRIIKISIKEISIILTV